MATISNANDPNRATQNVVQQPSTSGTPTSSGGYSTLQKYLQANQNAGQRVAGQVGATVNKEATNLQNTAQRELSESDQANKEFGNVTTQTTGFTQSLNQPGTGTSNTGEKLYDVNQYKANLSGQQAAADIAKNNLSAFRNIATGVTGTEAQQKSQAEAEQAVQQTMKAYDTNKQRQQDLASFGGRNQLIQQSLNTQNQRQGLQNLDAAFMSQDKNKTVDTIRQNLQQSTKGLVSQQDLANTQRSDITGLTEAQRAAELGLNTRLTDMDKEYGDVLAQRKAEVDAIKDARMAKLNEKYKRFQETGEIDQDLYDALQLSNAQDVDQARFTGGNVYAQKATQNDIPANKNIRLFNELKDKKLTDLLDTTLLTEKGASGYDYANQSDIDALSNLAALMGTENKVGMSKYTGKQLGESSLDENINARNQKFLNEDLMKTFQGSGYKQEDIGGSSAMARAYSQAAASLNDILDNKIFRNTQGSQSRGWENTLGTIANTIATGGSNILFNPDQADEIHNIVNAGGASLVPGLANSQLATPAAVMQYLQDLQGSMRGAGMTDAGGLSGRYIGEGEWGRSMNVAEAQAVGSVNQQANQYMNDIGYKNLLKLISENGSEY